MGGGQHKHCGRYTASQWEFSKDADFTTSFGLTIDSAHFDIDKRFHATQIASVSAVKLKSSILSGGTMTGLGVSHQTGSRGRKTRCGAPSCSTLLSANKIDSVKTRFLIGLLIVPFSMNHNPSRVYPRYNRLGMSISSTRSNRVTRIPRFVVAIISAMDVCDPVTFMRNAPLLGSPVDSPKARTPYSRGYASWVNTPFVTHCAAW